MSVYILGGLRTAIVVAGTKFKSLRPEIFGAEVLRALRQNFFWNASTKSFAATLSARAEIFRG